MHLRLSRQGYYFEVVQAVSMRGTCDRGRCGAILVKEGRILATGYVGAPRGFPHCDAVGHEIEAVSHANSEKTFHCVRTVHAELNAILQAAKFGIPIKGASMYCTMFPCPSCAMAIINCELNLVFSNYDYQRSNKSKELLDRAGIRWEVLHKDIELY